MAGLFCCCQVVVVISLSLFFVTEWCSLRQDCLLKISPIHSITHLPNYFLNHCLKRPFDSAINRLAVITVFCSIATKEKLSVYH